MDEAKALGFLGLAARAGQVTSGDGLCEREVRAGRAALVLLDEGVSDNTRDKYRGLCAARRVPLYEISADALGKAIGKPNRLIAAVAKGTLAQKLEGLLQ